MILTFGKYKGQHVENIEDDYKLWLYNQNISDLELRKYLEDNIETIKFRIENNKHHKNIRNY